MPAKIRDKKYFFFIFSCHKQLLLSNIFSLLHATILYSINFFFHLHKHVGITGSCSTSTFFRGKALFLLRFGLTMQKMTTYSSLVNPSAVSFTVWRELKEFPASWTKHLIPISSWESSSSQWAGTGFNGFCPGQELSSKQPILILYLSSQIHLF